MKALIDGIRQSCTESSFERGLDYFKQGRVKSMAQYRSTITAKVMGTSMYKVTIRVGGRIEAHCTCPYDFGGYCKHIVATAMALNKNKSVVNECKLSEKSIEATLNTATLEGLKKFLREEFESNPSLRTHFTIFFLGEDINVRSVYDYKKEIQSIYNELAGGDDLVEYGVEVDFSMIHDLAKRYAKANNLIEAVKIYRALSEAIAENMDMVDDSDGYYGSEFDKAVDGMVECIRKAKLKHEDKRPYIEYFFRKFMENDPDYFRENYDDALRRICSNREDLECLAKLLKPRMPKTLPDSDKDWCRHYESKELIMMQAHILKHLRKTDELRELLNRYPDKELRHSCGKYLKKAKT